MKTALIVSLTLTISIFTLGVAGLIYPGEAKPTDVWIPEGAEVRDASKTQEGTFKISEDLDEFQAKTKDAKTIMVYGRVSSPAEVVYWRPEGAVFYYSVSHPKPKGELSLWSQITTLGGRTGKITSTDGKQFYWQPVFDFAYFFPFVILFLCTVGFGQAYLKSISES